MKLLVHHLVIYLLTAAVCSAGGLRWDPGANHTCNIKRLTFSQVFKVFGPNGVPPLYHEPIILLRQEGRNDLFRERTRKDTILDNFPPDFNVTLSSSNSLSEHRRIIPFWKYLNESWTIAETPMGQKSNESWYLFGETYTDEWKPLLQTYELPPCHTCRKDLVALSFGVGNRGSGVQWHAHGPGFSEAIHGRKHWVLYPPDDRPKYLKDESSREWMEVAYFEAKLKPFECTCKLTF